MSNAIGDYIHYSGQNYNKYGIAQKGKGKIDYNFSIERIKKDYEKLVSGLTLTQKQTLANNINSIFQANIKKSDEDIYANAKKIIKEQLDSQFNSMTGKLSKTGNVSLTQAQKDALEKRKQLENLNQISTAEGIRRISSIKSKLMSIRDFAANNLKMSSIGGMTPEEISTISNNLLTELESLASTQRIIKVDKNGVAQGLSSNFLTEANRLIKAIQITNTINLQKGTAFEYALALSAYMMDNEAEKVTVEALKSVVGSSASKTQINLSGMPEGIKEAFSEFVYRDQYSIENNLLTSVLPSQNKVDIQYELKEGNTLSITAKNYNLSNSFAFSSDIHLLSGSNLLYLLQDEPNNFITHYFNIIADHPSREGGIDSRLIKAAHEEARAIIALKAIAGGTFSDKNKATLFAINDNTKTGANSIRLIDIKDIMDKILEDLNGNLNVTANNMPLENVRLKNNFAKDGFKYRIGALLADSVTKKISVAIPKTVIVNNF